MKLPDRRLPLWQVLIMAFVVQILSAIALVGYLSFRNGQKAVDSLAAQIHTAISHQVDHHLNTYLETPRQVNETDLKAMELGILKIQDFQQIGQFFWQQMQVFNISYLSFGSVDGEFVGIERLDNGKLVLNQVTQQTRLKRLHIYETNPQGQPTKLIEVKAWEPRSEPWYTETVKVNRPIWSSIFQWNDKPDVMSITSNYPVRDRAGQLQGVLSIDLVLSQISEFLRQLPSSQSSQIYIIEEDGKLVANSNSAKTYRLENGKAQRVVATESENSLIQTTSRRLIQQFQDWKLIDQAQSLHCQVDGMRHYLQVAPWRDEKGIRWLIIVATPESAFMEQIHANTLITGTLCFVGALVAIATSILMARWLTRPIQELSVASGAIAAGNLEQPIQLKPSSREVDRLAISFEHMRQTLAQARQQLETYAHSLEEQVAARTRALQYNEMELRTLVANIPGVVYRCNWDQSWQMTFFSPDVESLTGYPFTDVMHQTSFEQFIHPEDRTSTREAIQKSLQLREPYTLEYRIVKADGSIRWVADYGRGVFDVMGEFQQLDGVMFDITPQKELEDQQARSRQEIEAKNVQLEQTLQELQATQNHLIQSAKLAALGQLVASVAHEMNTPLGAIRSSIENIANCLGEELEGLPQFLKTLSPEHQADFFLLIQQSLDSIAQVSRLSSREKRQFRRDVANQLEAQQVEDADLIADTLVELGIYANLKPFQSLLTDRNRREILDIAYNITSSQRSVRTITQAADAAAKVVLALKTYAHNDRGGVPEAVNLPDSIETALTLLYNLTKRGVTIEQDYAADLPTIEGFPDDLRQVWMNLIHNAIQAMNCQGTIHITATPIEDNVTVSITDNGPGIPEEDQSYIFEPFFTTKQSGEGSGLGLSIVQKLITKHQGTIALTSVPGATTFTVTLPIVHLVKSTADGKVEPGDDSSDASRT